MDAIKKADEDKVKSIIESGIDINLKNERGDTVLHLFLKDKMKRISFTIETVVKILIYLIQETSFDISQPDSEGNTILHLLCKDPRTVFGRNFYDLIEVILSQDGQHEIPNQKGILPVYSYLANGMGNIDPEALKLLLSKTSNINFCDNNGRTLIHYLAEIPINEFNLGFIQSLWKIVLFHNPDLNQVDHDGNHILDRLENTPLYTALIEKGAKPIKVQEIEEAVHKINQITQTTASLLTKIAVESTMLYPKAKVEHFYNYINGTELIGNLDDVELTEQLQAANEGYKQLSDRLDIAFEVFDKISRHEVHSEKDISILEEKYRNTHYIFLNRQAFLEQGEAVIHVCPKIRFIRIKKNSDSAFASTRLEAVAKSI